MWRDFFYYAPYVKKGILVLLFLIAIAIWLNYFFLSPVPELADRFKEEERKAWDSLQRVGNKPEWKHYSRQKRLRRPVVLRPFDPNTVDSLTMLDLGFPSWMAHNLIRYRQAGKVFRAPDELKALYGMDSDLYRSISPYIQISDCFQQQEEEPKVYAPHRDSVAHPLKYAPGVKVDLNVADTTELKKIPGVGSGIARLIVEYRRRLGGYYTVEQLAEVQLNVELLRPWFVVDASSIERLNPNKMGVERLKRHPYINFYQAKRMVDYRKRRGPISNLLEFRLCEEFTSQDFDRLSHYLRFD